MGRVFSMRKYSSGMSFMRRSILRSIGGPKVSEFTTWDRFAIDGLMLWCLERISMWKLPGTLQQRNG